jgi:hypothetical protein
VSNKPDMPGATTSGSVSLWDMLQRYAFGFYDVVCRLEAMREVARISESAGSSYSSKVPDSTRGELLESLPKMRKECDALSLDSTSDLVGRLESEVPRKGDKYTYKDLWNDLDTLSFSFSSGLKKRIAFLIGDEKKKYFQGADLIGPKVTSAFPLCASEITNAGNCYALEQNEACVFHCMCTLEIALHVLAKELGVTFSGTLDLQNWQNIIESIEAEIKKLGNLPQGRYKSETLKFLSGAAMQFRWFKDAWRNHVMHGRDIYDPGKAFSVFDHVRQFMQALAEGGLTE